MFYLRAYDCPLRDEPIINNDCCLVHENEIGAAKDLPSALLKAEEWSQNNRFYLYEKEPFPLHLIYLSEWCDDDDEILRSASYEEWKEKQKRKLQI